MEVINTDNNLRTSGVTRTTEFGISKANEVFIMNILRNKLYSRKELAVIREYAANAWDEHRQCGRGDISIEVHIPTTLEPYLEIKDFGRGLSEEDIFRVFTQYGESTKRDTNMAVGFMGIGSKSAFAYADQFTVTSRYGGKISTYIAALDQTQRGNFMLINTADHDPSDTGLTIRVAVNPADVPTFEREAREFFRFFRPRPNINLELQPEPDWLGDAFLIETNGTCEPSGRWIAVMGCIPYHLDTDALEDEINSSGMSGIIGHMSGGLYINVGDVTVSANREELEYTDLTKSVIEERLTELVSGYVEKSLHSLEAGSDATWLERRKGARMLHENFGITLPRKYKHLLRDRINLFGYEKKGPAKGRPHTSGKTFYLKDSPNNITNALRWDGREKLVFVDDEDISSTNLGRYRMDYNDRFIVPKKVDDPSVENGWRYATKDEVMKELKSRLRKACLSNPIVESIIDSRGKYPSYASSYTPRAPAPKNRKHSAKLFRYNGGTYHTERSRNWDLIEHEASEDDVYLVISKFTPEYCDNFRAKYDSDLRLCKELELPMPTIFGHKTTAKKPLGRDTPVGVHYDDWRDKLWKNALTSEMKKKISQLDWLELDNSWQHSTRQARENTMSNLKEDLGEKHPLTLLYKRHMKVATNASKLIGEWALRKLRDNLNRDKNKLAPRKALYALSERYEPYSVVLNGDTFRRLRCGDYLYANIISGIRFADACIMAGIHMETAEDLPSRKVEEQGAPPSDSEVDSTETNDGE